jgi:DNA topoisomerase I
LASATRDAARAIEPGSDLDPQAAAEEADLIYISDTAPGIRRLKSRGGFRYMGPDGSPVRDETTLQRIRRLAVPPAWTDVWIAPHPDAHLQATGRDARGRKQYRYHPRWREVRDRTKYERMIAFAEALPTIRDRIDAEMRLPGLPRAKVLATVVKLLETTLIRVGNREYAEDNKSFGLTTMRDRHVDIDGSTLRFEFTGKGGKKHSVRLRDRRLASIVKRCQEIRGQQLFQYIDEEGQRQAIDSADVNEYLREISGQSFTAKDFRTWAGTVLAAMALQEVEAFESEAEAKRNVVQAIERVARHLGNTAAICRKCYVHPHVIDDYMEGTLVETLRQRANGALDLNGLAPEEAAVLSLLKRRLERESQSAAAG